MNDGGNPWEAEFTLCCTQCGGDEFQQVFLVPAAVFRDYGRGTRPTPGRELVVSVYVCQQCGHLEWFVDPRHADPDGHGS